MDFKHKLAIVITVLAAAAFAGGAYAATQESPVTQRQAFLNDVAKRRNVSPQKLTAALEAAFQDQLNAAVRAGKLTQAQANAIAKRLQQGSLPARWFGLGGLLYPAAPPAAANQRGPHSGGTLGAAASYLGLSRAQLFKDLHSGKTLAQIASSRGKSVSGMEKAMIAALKSRLDQAVADKRITASQEKQILARLSSRIDSLVNRTTPGFGSGRHGFFFPRPGAHPGASQGGRPGRLPGALLPPPPPPGPTA